MNIYLLYEFCGALKHFSLDKLTNLADFVAGGAGGAGGWAAVADKWH